MKRIPFNALVVLVCLAGCDLRLFAQTSTPTPQAPSASQPSETSQTGPSQQKAAAKPAKDAPPTDDPEEQIPVVRLEFKPVGVVPGVNGTPVVAGQVVCSADGVPYVSFMDAKSVDIVSVTSLDPKGGHVFSTQQIQGLYGISSIGGVFVTDSMVGLRITATKDPTKAPQTIGTREGAPPMNGYSGKRRFFLAEFDLSGNFSKAVEIGRASCRERVCMLV